MQSKRRRSSAVQRESNDVAPRSLSSRATTKKPTPPATELEPGGDRPNKLLLLAEAPVRCALAKGHHPASRVVRATRPGLTPAPQFSNHHSFTAWRARAADVRTTCPPRSLPTLKACLALADVMGPYTVVVRFGYP
eukprot:tig00021013_g17052.t1